MSGYCISSVRFMASVAAAAAAGALTALQPIAIGAGGSLITPNVAGDASASVGRDGKFVFCQAGQNMAAAVRLATAAGTEAYRDALEGLVVQATLSGRTLLDNVPFTQLAGGPPSTLATTSMDLWTPPGAGMGLDFETVVNDKLSVSVVQTRITTVAIADLWVAFNAQLEV